MSEDFHLLYRYGGKTNVANPSSTLNQWANQDTYPVPTSRPATAQDMTDAARANLTELLFFLGDQCGYNDQQKRDAALTLGYAEDELEQIAVGEAAGKLDKPDALRRNTFTALMCEAAIELNFTVSNIDILQATEATLRDWESVNYPEAIAETYTELARVQETITNADHSSHAGWCMLRAKLERRLGMFWQCRQRLGINPFSGAVANVDLSLLEQFEAAHATA